MNSSSRKVKVNRKPLFKKRIISEPEESSNDGRGRNQEALTVVAPDNKRSKPVAQDANSKCQGRRDTSNKCDGAISVTNECSTRKPTKNKSKLDEDFLPSPLIINDASKTERVNPPNHLSINVKRKKLQKTKIRHGLEYGSSKIPEMFYNDILDDEMLFVSAFEKDDKPGSKSAGMDLTVAKNLSNENSNLNSFSKTSTPLRIPSGKSNDFSLISSPKQSPVGGDKISECNDSIMDYFNEDDSKLAALDMSDVISSHDSDKNNLKSEKMDLDSKELSAEADKQLHVQGIQQDYSGPGQMSDGVSNQCQRNNKRVTTDGVPNKEETKELFYGLPINVGNLIKKYKGIEKLYDWQNDCLNLPGLQKRQNLIYSLPTSGGKTLVAEILIMKELLCHGKDAMLILPFVSIVQEKVRDLSLFAVDLEFLVEEYASSKGMFPPRKRRKRKSLYVATIEKANGLVNSLIEENRLSEVGLVVVDELHMLGEGGQRGATLEMCLVKILFCSSSTQVIGMSATLSNIEDLQRFLKAEKYVNDFRPVELREYFKIEEEIFEIKKDKIGRNEEVPFKRSRRMKHQTNDKNVLMRDPDHLSLLVQDVIPKYSCLIFCATKKNCENVAELLAQMLPRDFRKVKVNEKHELLRALKSNADRVCPILRRVVPYGIAYHHSGLTMDERKIIEEAYSQGTLCLLTCTSTLAAGVNLPAKRVILRSPYVGINAMSRSQYKQMVGRAGRAGIDTSGESILILNKKDKEKVMDLVNAPLESCHSSLLHNNGQGLRSLVLSLIGLKICNSLEELQQFISKTLLAVQNDEQKNTTLQEKINENVNTLVSAELVRKCECVMEGRSSTKVETTDLGRATFKGCIDVDRSLFIFEEIKRAQENLVLANDLHLLYLVTTPDLVENIKLSWMGYLKQFSSLKPAEQKAAELVGITEAFLSRNVAGQRSKKTDKEMIIVKRFYLTLMLYKIVQEHSLWDVANGFDVPRGFLQSLFSSSSSFASCLVHFTKELPEFYSIKLLLETIVDKLAYTAVLELVPLMQIPGVKKARAKQLFAAGYRNLQTVAKSDPGNLVKEIEHLSKSQAQVLVSSAKMLLLEKAEALQEEAADLIEM